MYIVGVNELAQRNLEVPDAHLMGNAASRPSGKLHLVFQDMESRCGLVWPFSSFILAARNKVDDIVHVRSEKYGKQTV